MNTNFTNCYTRAFQTKVQVEELRQKILRETEQYLNNPSADSWARLGDSRASAKKLENIFA